jgi:hypothetical protein
VTLVATRDLLESEKEWVISAIVRVLENETQHWSRSAEGVMLVSVETTGHGIGLWVMLGGGDDAGTGVWMIPAVGTEVVVGFDDGDFEGNGRLIAIHGHAPVGMMPNVTLVLGASIEARSAGGVATKLPTLADYNALRTTFNTHTHAVATTGTSSAQTGTAAAVTSPVGSPAGTSTFKAE